MYQEFLSANLTLCQPTYLQVSVYKMFSSSKYKETKSNITATANI